MSYKSANNSYSDFEWHISNELHKNIDDMNFMSNNNIMGIFGVEKEWGYKYCDQIQKEFPDFVNIVHKGILDSIFIKLTTFGKPDNFYSDILKKNLSANTSRYIYHALLIQKYIYEKYKNISIDIVEIGGGYGGLAFWLQVLNKNISKYYICDLPVITQFQYKCLLYFDTECEFILNPLEFTKSDRPLFCISNYGFSEFNINYQNMYTETIIKKATNGFMIWNNWTGIYKFTDNIITQENERPCFEGTPNLFLYF